MNRVHSSFFLNCTKYMVVFISLESYQVQSACWSL